MRSATDGPRRPGRGRELRSLLEEERIRPRRRSSQNFLVDQRVEDAIVRLSAPGKDDFVLEIGAGAGFLTHKLADAAGELVAVEIDRGLCRLLEKRLAAVENVRIVRANILDVDIGRLAGPGRLKVVGNLPYSITSPILFRLFESAGTIETAVVMVQREFGARMRAGVGDEGYGALSVAVSWKAVIEEGLPVSRSCFWPEPGVDSLLVRMRMRREPPVDVLDEDVLTAVVRGAFGKRRKRVVNSLAMSEYGGLEKEDWRLALSGAEIDGGRRAEELSLEEFARLANEVVRLPGVGRLRGTGRLRGQGEQL